MALTQDSFYIASTGYPAGVAPSIYTYKSLDPLADIKVDGYFNGVIPALKINDLIYVNSSDDVELMYIASIDPITTADLVVESEFELQPNSVGTPELMNESVTADQLGDSSVSHIKLQDASVSGDKIAPLGIPHGAYGLQTIDGGDMMDGACGTAQIEDNAISTIKIQSNAIDNRTIAANACEAEQIASNAISNPKVLTDAIDTRTIENGAVGAAQLDNDMWQVKTIESFSGDGQNPLVCPIPGVVASDRAIPYTFTSHISIPVGAVCYNGGVYVRFNASHVASQFETIMIIVFTRGSNT